MKTVVMTGGTRGLGREASRIIAETKGTQLLLGARSATMTQGEALALDLSSLSSVQMFARAVSDKLGSSPIDALVLNAGAQFGNLNRRTHEGFETTFAVNHLAHYLLLRLLIPTLARRATVVITTFRNLRTKQQGDATCVLANR
jgi:NAD(P)-dependent dehydrogenase (short-subunit alcohol dehydrogenase family)